MKKLLVFLLFFSIFVLSACDDGEPIELVCEGETHLEDGVCMPNEVQEVECTNNQIKVEDVCVDLLGTEIALRDALAKSDGLDNYQLTTLIDTHSIVLQVDGNIRKLVTPAYIEYFKVEGDLCFAKPIFNDVVEESSEACSDETNLIYSGLDYSWFELVSGKYQLKSEYNDVVSNNFEGSNVIFFQLSIKDGYVSEVYLEIQELTTVYYMMQFDLIDAVDLDYNEVN